MRASKLVYTYMYTTNKNRVSIFQMKTTPKVLLTNTMNKSTERATETVV